MKQVIIVHYILFIFFIVSCNNTDYKEKNTTQAYKVINKDSLQFPKRNIVPELLDTLTAPFEEGDLVDVTFFSKDMILDIRYATENNFLDTILYPCAKCLLRYEVLKDLLRVESEFRAMGYRIKLFDCYRPLSVQKIMWKKVPLVGFVADPATGSRHNRGSAVDITITDALGYALDMGTDHDDMSLKGRTFYRGFNDTIFNNRMLLRTVMERHHFIGINSEWWHFSHDCATKYKVSDVGFGCDSLK